MDLQSKTEEAVLQGHTAPVSILVITSDNKYIVSASDGWDRTVRIWNLQDKTEEAVLEGHTDSVLSLAITSDNKYIVSAGSDKSVRIWLFQHQGEVILPRSSDAARSYLKYP